MTLKNRNGQNIKGCEIRVEYFRNEREEMGEKDFNNKDSIESCLRKNRFSWIFLFLISALMKQMCGEQ